MATAVTLPDKQVFVNSGNPTTNYYSNKRLIVGYADASPGIVGVNRSWIRCPLKDAGSGIAVPAGSTINVGTKLVVKSFYSDGNDYAGVFVDLSRATDISWDPTTMTYNTAPNGSITGGVIDEQDMEGGGGSGGQDWTFDNASFIAAIQAALDSGAGYVTFRLKEASEAAGFVILTNSDYGSSPGRPQLTIVYTPPSSRRRSSVVLLTD